MKEENRKKNELCPETSSAISDLNNKKKPNEIKRQRKN